MIRLCSLYSKVRNVNLIKSNGMLPYSMHLLGNYKTKVVCYKQGEYPYIDIMIAGVGLDFLDRKYNNSTLDGCRYIRHHAKEIDVLTVYHLVPESLVYAAFFRFFNRKGIVYLKTDNTQDGLFDRNPIKKFIKKRIMRNFDIVSSESWKFCENVNRRYGQKFVFIPNGFYEKEFDYTKTHEKKKIVLTVARIGAPEKAHDIMVEGFLKATAHIDDEWMLKLVGPYTQEFAEYIDKVHHDHPDMKDRIVLVGNISDRDELKRMYDESAIFALTSISEGFPTVYVEAIRSGCYIVTSRLEYISEEITNDEQFGRICEPRDSEGFADILIDACNNKVNTVFQKDIIKYAYDNYYWPKTGEKLDKYIRDALKKRNARDRKTNTSMEW